MLSLYWSNIASRWVISSGMIGNALVSSMFIRSEPGKTRVIYQAGLSDEGTPRFIVRDVQHISQYYYEDNFRNLSLTGAMLRSDGTIRIDGNQRRDIQGR